MNKAINESSQVVVYTHFSFTFSLYLMLRMYMIPPSDNLEPIVIIITISVCFFAACQRYWR